MYLAIMCLKAICRCLLRVYTAQPSAVYQLTMSMDFVHSVPGQIPWTLSMELFHGHCPWNFSMDIVHGFCPLIPWTISMDCGKSPWIPWKSSMDILEKFHGHTGKTPWTFSIDSLEIAQCFRSNTPAGQCPWIPWTLSTDSMDFFHWFHGLSTDGYQNRKGKIF